MLLSEIAIKLENYLRRKVTCNIIVVIKCSFCSASFPEASRLSAKASVANLVKKGAVRMKALVKWFDGVDIRIPFVSIKFKKPNNNSTLSNATRLNKTNNQNGDDC